MRIHVKQARKLTVRIKRILITTSVSWPGIENKNKRNLVSSKLK